VQVGDPETAGLVDLDGEVQPARYPEEALDYDDFCTVGVPTDQPLSGCGRPRRERRELTGVKNRRP
jgi:hypothetical protein